MTRFSTLLIAAAALAIPAIASAAPKPEEPRQATGADAATPRAQRYCVVEKLTGSNLDHRECKTLDGWLAEGFDPRKVSRK